MMSQCLKRTVSLVQYHKIPNPVVHSVSVLGVLTKPVEVYGEKKVSAHRATNALLGFHMVCHMIISSLSLDVVYQVQYMYCMIQSGVHVLLDV